MRKTVGVIIALSLVFLFAAAASAQDIRLSVDGKEHVLTDAEVWNGHLFVPLAEFAESLGLNYQWEADTGRAWVFGEDLAFHLEVVPGQKHCLKSGIRMTWPTPPVMHRNRLYIPLRPAAEFLDYAVGYDQGLVTLTFPSVPARSITHTGDDGRQWEVYLRSPWVTSMTEDDAFLWAGTATSGVWRISKANPREMVQYTTFNSNLPDNRISLAETTPDGTKWFVTEAGLVRLVGEEPEFEQVDARFGRKGVQTAAGPDGSIWMYDGRLVHLTASGETEFIDAPEGIRALAVDPEGTLWMADTAGKVYRQTAEGLLERFTALDRYIDTGRRGHIERIFIDSDGSKWFVLFQDLCPPEEWNPFMTQRTLLHLLPDGTVETVGAEQGLGSSWSVQGFVPQPNGDILLLMTERRSLDATVDYTFTLDREEKLLKDKREYNHFTNANGQSYLIDRETGQFVLVESGREPVVFNCDVNSFPYPGRAFFLDGALWYAHRDGLCRINPAGTAGEFAYPENYLFGPVVKVERADGGHRLFVCSPWGMGGLDRVITLTGDGRFVYSNSGFGGNFFYREGVDHDTLWDRQRWASDLLGGAWVDDVIYELDEEYRYVLCRDQETYRGRLVAVDSAGNAVRGGDELPDLGPGRMLYVDPAGGLWAVFRDGVVQFSFRDGVFAAVRVFESPLKGGVNYMLIDGDTLWLAAEGGAARSGI